MMIHAWPPAHVRGDALQRIRHARWRRGRTPLRLTRRNRTGQVPSGSAAWGAPRRSPKPRQPWTAPPA